MRLASVFTNGAYVLELVHVEDISEKGTNGREGLLLLCMYYLLCES